MDRAEQFDGLGLVDRHGQQQAQHVLGFAQRDLGLLDADLGAVELDADAVEVGLADPIVAQLRMGQLVNLGQAVAIGRGIAQRFAGRDHVEIGHVQPIDRQPHRVLILGLEHALGLAGHFGAGRPLVADVDRINHRRAVRGLARPLHRIAAVGNRRDGAEDQRIRPQAGGEHVGPGLRNFHATWSADRSSFGPVD